MRALGANVTTVAGGTNEAGAAARDLANGSPGYRLVYDGEPAAVAEGHGRSASNCSAPERSTVSWSRSATAR